MVATLIQDVRYALRQLRKTPGFTATAVLTLALGIGANAAIFTLVNAVLMKDLPVADPRTLLRIGDNNDCCVDGGAQENGDYTLFPTETYLLLKKNVPEFEELAAMQAGFGFRPIIARRDGSHEGARSVMGEFVSGNYFRTFGLRPHAGRLLSDLDDLVGAPMVAVMSYEAWQRDYLGDGSVVGSTFWVNTKAVTIAGIAPEGFYGDRLSSTPPDLYLPIETMPVLANAPYVHDPGARWLYLVGRVKPGVHMVPLQEKLSALVRQSFAETKTFSLAQGKALLTKAHVVLTPGGAGIQELQEAYASNLHLLMTISGLITDRERRAGLAEWNCGVGRSVCRNADAADAGIPRSAEYSHSCRPVDGGTGVCLRTVAADGHPFRRGTGLDYCAISACRCSAERSTDEGDGYFAPTARAGGVAGGTLAGAVGWRRIVFAEPE